SQLASGELFDHQAGPVWSFARGFQLPRLPVLTILVALGLVVAWRRGSARGERYTAWAFLLWVALYCGRPTWGSALYLVGISRDVPLHRLIGAVHLFGILLAGLALGRGAARLALGRRAAAEPDRKDVDAQRRSRRWHPDGRRRARLWAAPIAA